MAAKQRYRDLPELPNNLDAEGAVLGAILLEDSTLAAARQLLQPLHFYRREHQQIYACMLALGDAGKPADLVTVTDALRKAGHLENAGGAAYISKLIDGVPKSSNLEHYAQIVRDASVRRRLMHLARGLEHAAERDPGAIELRLAEIKKAGAELNGAGAHPGLELTPLSDLLNEPEENVPWALDGILPAGGSSLLAGKPKAGKSTLARNIALAVARGELFFNRATAKGRVIYLALEEKRAKVRSHFRQMGATGAEPIEILAAPAPAQPLGMLRSSLAQEATALVIIDTMQRFAHIGDLNDYAHVSAALEPIHDLAREFGCHILVVHHLRKSEASELGDVVLGSQAFSGAVDTLLGIRRRDRVRTLQSLQRYGEDLPERVLQFDSARGVLTLGPEKAEADRQAMEPEILTFLEGRGPEPEAVILAGVDGDTGAKRAALRELVKQGKVQRSGEGRRGAPYQYLVCSSIDITQTSKRESAESTEVAAETGTSTLGFSSEASEASRRESHISQTSILAAPDRTKKPPPKGPRRKKKRRPRRRK